MCEIHKKSPKTKRWSVRYLHKSTHREDTNSFIQSKMLSNGYGYETDTLSLYKRMGFTENMVVQIHKREHKDVK